MNNNGYKNHVARFDGKNVFVEFTEDGFDIDKIIVGFYRYDENQAKGDRIKEKILIYIKDTDWFQLCYEIEMRLTMKKRIEALKAGKNFENLSLEIQGGTMPVDLKKQKRERPDGKAEARLFTIIPSTLKKYDYGLRAESGPGERDENGLIVPKFVDNKPDTRIIVPVTHSQLVSATKKVNMKLQAYYTTQELKYQMNKARYQKNDPRNGYEG